MSYLALKHLHITLVSLSIGFFLVRGIWMWNQSGLLQRKWVKIVPHIVDTLLVIAGVSLAVMLHFKPTEQPWLMAKLIALVLYIVLGTLALKRAKTMAGRRAAFIAALLCAAYMVGVAIRKTPWLF